MRTTCIQQIAIRNYAFFRLASLIHLKRWRGSSSATFRVPHGGSQSGKTAAINAGQLYANHNTFGFYDCTRTSYFSKVLCSNHKLYLGCSGTAWCRSASNVGRTHSEHCTRRTTPSLVLHNLQRSNDIFTSEQYFTNHRCIHTSQRANILFPPQVWLLLKPAQKLFAIIIGRSVRKWWKALPPNKQDLFKEKVKRNKWKLLASLSGLGVVFVLFYFTHLEDNPITGRTRLLVFRKEHYDFLTKLEYEGFIEEFKDQMIPERDPRHIVVQKIVDHLIECNCDIPVVKEVKWVVHVVEKSDINAFVLPNGQMFVFTGLLESVTDTHQLSFILGHEIAHVLLEHTAEMASVSHFLDFLFLISLMMIWAVCPLDSLAVLGQWIQSKLKEFMFDRPYGRTLEAEADHVGLQLAAKACTDVRASSVFWQQMELLETLEGQLQIPQWLSTHPSHENRVEHLNKLIPEEHSVHQQKNRDSEPCKHWLRSSATKVGGKADITATSIILALKLRENCNCPALSGPDPRLAFQLTVQKIMEDSNRKSKTMPEPIETQALGLPFKVDDKHPALAAVIAVEK